MSMQFDPLLGLQAYHLHQDAKTATVCMLGLDMFIGHFHWGFFIIMF